MVRFPLLVVTLLTGCQMGWHLANQLTTAEAEAQTAVCQPGCSGIPPACAAYNNQTTCAAALGCYWINAGCSGSIDCPKLDPSNCNNTLSSETASVSNNGCYETPFTCTPNPGFSCSNFTDSNSCPANSCQWVTASSGCTNQCSMAPGSPTPCAPGCVLNGSNSCTTSCSATNSTTCSPNNTICSGPTCTSTNNCNYTYDSCVSGCTKNCSGNTDCAAFSGSVTDLNNCVSPTHTNCVVAAESYSSSATGCTSGIYIGNNIACSAYVQTLSGDYTTAAEAVANADTGCSGISCGSAVLYEPGGSCGGNEFETNPCSGLSFSSCNGTPYGPSGYSCWWSTYVCSGGTSYQCDRCFWNARSDPTFACSASDCALGASGCDATCSGSFCDAYTCTDNGTCGSYPATPSGCSNGCTYNPTATCSPYPCSLTDCNSAYCTASSSPAGCQDLGVICSELSASACQTTPSCVYTDANCYTLPSGGLNCTSLNQSDCKTESVVGCVDTPTSYCASSPDSCVSYSDPNSCTGASGCNWTACPSSQPTSVPVVAFYQTFTGGGLSCRSSGTPLIAVILAATSLALSSLKSRRKKKN